MTLLERVEAAPRGSVVVLHAPTGRLLASRDLTPSERRAPAVTVTLVDAESVRRSVVQSVKTGGSDGTISS